MKNFLFSLLLVTTLTGCTRHYVVTLDSGKQITAMGKPKLQGSNYVFKDATGQKGFVPAGRVREIAPASMAESTSTSQFKTRTKK